METEEVKINSEITGERSVNFVKMTFLRKGKPSYIKVGIPRELETYEVTEMGRMVKNMFADKIPDFLIMKSLKKEIGQLKSYIDEMEYEVKSSKAEAEEVTKSIKKKEKELNKLINGAITNPEARKALQDKSIDKKIKGLENEVKELTEKTKKEIKEIKAVRDRLIYENSQLKNKLENK